MTLRVFIVTRHTPQSDNYYSTRDTAFWHRCGLTSSTKFKTIRLTFGSIRSFKTHSGFNRQNTQNLHSSVQRHKSNSLHKIPWHQPLCCIPSQLLHSESTRHCRRQNQAKEVFSSCLNPQESCYRIHSSLSVDMNSPDTVPWIWRIAKCNTSIVDSLLYNAHVNSVYHWEWQS